MPLNLTRSKGQKINIGSKENPREIVIEVISDYPASLSIIAPGYIVDREEITVKRENKL